MARCPQSLVLLIVSFFVHLTIQVNIEMTWERYPEDWQDAQTPREVVSASWEDAEPGKCYKPHHSVLPYLGYLTHSIIRVDGLQLQQFAAGWGTAEEFNTDIPNCEGSPVARFFGPGQWLHRIRDDADDGTGLSQIPDDPAFITAASWIDLRTRFPASSAETRYLQFQGVNKLIWGKNTWSAGSDGIPFPKMVRRGMKRLNDWAQQGTAYIQQPTTSVYPDRYLVNGTNYTNTGDGSYKSTEGVVLDIGGG